MLDDLRSIGRVHASRIKNVQKLQLINRNFSSWRLVSTSQPESVIRTICSHWQDGLPGETIENLSWPIASMSTVDAMVTIGSMVKAIPGISLMSGISLESD